MLNRVIKFNLFDHQHWWTKREFREGGQLLLPHGKYTENQLDC